MLRTVCLAAFGAALVACSGGGGGSGGQGTTTSATGEGGSTTTTSSTTGSSSTSATGTGGTGTTSSTGSTGSTTTGAGGTGTGGTGTGGTGTGGTGTGGEMIGPGPYFISYSAAGPGIDTRPSVTATFSGQEIVGFVASPMESPVRGTNVTSEAGMDAFIAWGRWNGGTTAGTFYANPGVVLSPTQGWHLVLGHATPAAMVPATGSADYALLATTRPTIEDGSLPIGKLTGSIKAAFSGGTTHLGVSLSIDMPTDVTYVVTSNGGTAAPATSEVTVIGVNYGAIGGQIPISSAGKACTGGATCKISFQGFMAGPNAERIGLAFVLSAGKLGTQVRGVAIFARQ